jgi:prepilin-type N-terminal cleavage/methylation domain-containing protein
MSRSGMTLVELVVAIAIVATVVTLGHAALGIVTDRRDRLLASAAEVSRTATVRRELSGWLGGARIDPNDARSQFRGLDGEEWGIPSDEITFRTTSPGLVADGEATIRLFIDRDSLTAERGLTAEVTIAGATTPRRFELEERVSGLEIRYFTRMMGEAAWLPSWISSTVTPAGVELVLLSRELDSLPPLLGMPVVVAVGPSR